MDDFEGLPVLPARRMSVRWGARYRVGPLSPLSDSSTASVAIGIRTGALIGLAVVAALSVPFFLVLGAKAPSRHVSTTPPSARTAKVWAEEPVVVAPPSATFVAAADEVRQVPVAPNPEPARAAKASETRPPLGLELIPVLDDESGDLSFEEAPPAVKPPARPLRGTAGPRP
ncbi:hypothetical protein G3T14_14695 [Methylobacterium sp. BTF04]|uniref:hypothetical protein n=1 Tax=Methylobacterium sp. BTF04 TaxID=2708300 RepID=UPI0013D113A8|nr:hypothetical protein [Methylobacterium sp. BTF04]NEU13369.1 hypothetical protein [Methylobacterium sp. BTF04]